MSTLVDTTVSLFIRVVNAIFNPPWAIILILVALYPLAPKALNCLKDYETKTSK